MKKAVAGTVLGVGMAAMAITGAGAASADPISSVNSVTGSVNHTVDRVTGSFNKTVNDVTGSVNHTVNGVTGSFNNTVTTVAKGVKGNEFVSNLGSGRNIQTFSNSLQRRGSGVDEGRLTTADPSTLGGGGIRVAPVSAFRIQPPLDSSRATATPQHGCRPTIPTAAPTFHE